jgi:hypothetical protein
VYKVVVVVVVVVVVEHQQGHADTFSMWLHVFAWCWCDTPLCTVDIIGKASQHPSV